MVRACGAGRQPTAIHRPAEPGVEGASAAFDIIPRSFLNRTGRFADVDLTLNRQVRMCRHRAAVRMGAASRRATRPTRLEGLSMTGPDRATVISEDTKKPLPQRGKWQGAASAPFRHEIKMRHKYKSSRWDVK